MKHLLDDSILQHIEQWQMKTVLIVRRGQLLTEWHEGGRDSLSPLYSCTKSVLSALICLALERGFITSIDQPIGDYLQVTGFNDSSLVERITIKHLLTMTPGFHWPDFDKPYKPMRAAADPVAFTLMRPIIHEPGHAFTYNSGGSHLLSALLTAATGQSALQFAKEQLFQPLAFKAARWSERSGISEGGTGLSLYAADLAKLGVLFLQRGLWEGQQLLSPHWIEASTSLHHRGLLYYEPPLYGGYGFHWWVSPREHNGCADCYFAYGHGGQILMNIPELELTFVVRKKIGKRNEGIVSRKLIFEHLVPKILKLM